MVTYINPIPLNVEQSNLVLEAKTFGIEAKWWGKPEEAVSRLYIKNKIVIGESDEQVRIFYKFAKPETLEGAELKVSTQEMLDKETYKALMKGVREFLAPLTARLGISEYKSAPINPTQLSIVVAGQMKKVGDVGDPKYTSTDSVRNTQNDDDIPF